MPISYYILVLFSRLFGSFDVMFICATGKLVLGLGKFICNFLPEGLLYSLHTSFIFTLGLSFCIICCVTESVIAGVADDETDLDFPVHC